MDVRSPSNRSLYFTLLFMGGMASSLFLFLAGVATAMSAASKGRREGSHRRGAAMARRRGWEIFVLGLVFRVQAQVLGFAPLMNIFKVDMLNTMGLAIVGASYVWQWSEDRRTRLIALAVVTAGITMVTPLVRAVGWLALLPDPMEASASGRTVRGVSALSVGGVPLRRSNRRRAGRFHESCVATSRVLAGSHCPRCRRGAWLAWSASFRPALFHGIVLARFADVLLHPSRIVR